MTGMHRFTHGKDKTLAIRINAILFHVTYTWQLSAVLFVVPSPARVRVFSLSHFHHANVNDDSGGSLHSISSPVGSQGKQQICPT